MLPPEPALNGQDQDAPELVDAELVASGEPVDAREVQAARMDVRELARRNPAVVAATAAAVVGTGFVAGAVASAVVSQKVATVRRRRDARRIGPVLGSQRFLVDVHLLGGR